MLSIQNVKSQAQNVNVPAKNCLKKCAKGLVTAGLLTAGVLAADAFFTKGLTGNKQVYKDGQQTTVPVSYYERCLEEMKGPTLYSQLQCRENVTLPGKVTEAFRNTEKDINVLTNSGKGSSEAEKSIDLLSKQISYPNSGLGELFPTGKISNK